MTAADMPELADLIARALKGTDNERDVIAGDVTAFRSRFSGIAFTADQHELAGAPSTERGPR